MKKETHFLFSQFDVSNKVLAGMTLKGAGNFSPNSSFAEAFKMADMALTISGFNQVGYVVMRAENHGDDVWFFEKLKKNKSTQVFCDGVIYYGPGSAIFFPGGCPTIILCDEKANISGLLHGGWKSITQNIVDRFLTLWENVSGRKETTQIVFLPSMCGDCLKYEKDGYNYFLKTVYPIIKVMRPNDNDQFIHIENRSINFNLVGLIRELFTEKGYKKINDTGECVCCSGKYWCYSRDDKNGIKYRNAAFIITG